MFSMRDVGTSQTSSNRVIGVLLVFSVAAAVCISRPAVAQQSGPRSSLDQKLQQKVQFKSKADAPLDQLIELAKTFQVPMGIEWIESAKCNPAPSSFRDQETVLELLHDIVRRCPAQRLAMDRRVVHVYSRFTRHSHNILNLRVWRFHVKQGNMFDAAFELRLAIDMELHPEKYTGGYNGGYGYPPDDPLSVPNVSFSGRNIRVRDILDGIITSSGNALWVVRLSVASFDRRVPLRQMYKGDEEIVRIWRFFPLQDTP